MTAPTATPPAPPVDPAAPVAESARTVWVRRGIIAVLLIGATAGLIWGGSQAETGLPKPEGDAAVVALFPPPNSQVLSQTEVGAQLKDGYDGRLSINGVAVPEAELEGVLVPGSPEAVGYTGKELRPNNRNRVFFKPGPGKSVESLRQGRNIITIRYFKDGRPSTSRTATWAINVT